jgi:hypothetical protein
LIMIPLLFSFPLLSDMSLYCAWVQSRLHLIQDALEEDLRLPTKKQGSE